ncbi:glycine cleavage system protein GcvH [Vibrio porteresiae]|uniref:Glycine cleavage system H protein n=1 Tax=Vibrio porteresiae DSM 19223 TaxID=1123496 RepID=A0ABZ0QGA4_9VIBR|nr:glycine cleavage system protein GcvH [Vibrio porteresiae]WPC75521.1 glycine cleavage system protein GcvH [Vibrio porteresiae DSM 19223]
MDKTLKFTDSHEWVRDNGDGTATIGISEHAQEMLGDVVFVELPEVDSEIDAGDTFSLVESVKAASDIYAPVSGVVIEVNEDLEDSPELVNSEPYDGGWIVTIKMSDPSELNDLQTAAEYEASLEEEEDEDDE